MLRQGEGGDDGPAEGGRGVDDDDVLDAVHLEPLGLTRADGCQHAVQPRTQRRHHRGQAVAVGRRPGGDRAPGLQAEGHGEVAEPQVEVHAALRRGRTAVPTYDLSARERQVLNLLVAGRSVPSLAASLHISPSTAKTYVSRVYDKLGARNRAEAVMAAVRLGLTGEPAELIPSPRRPSELAIC